MLLISCTCFQLVLKKYSIGNFSMYTYFGLHDIILKQNKPREKRLLLEKKNG